MKTLMRTLTLSAAALAALVAAPKSNAQEFRRGEARVTARGNPGRGNPSYRNPGYGNSGRGNPSYRNPGYGNPGHGGSFRGETFRGREFRGNDWHNRGFGRQPAYFYGHRYGSPFRVFAGSRFYSYCPGPDYIYVDDFGWVFPPFSGAFWVPRFDRFGVRIGGFWR
jgi:hypothetical protein